MEKADDCLTAVRVCISRLLLLQDAPLLIGVPWPLLLHPPTPLLLSAKVVTRGLMFWAVFSIHASKSKSPSILGTVESAPIDIPTIEARSSNASWLAVKSSVSSLVIPTGGLEDPLEVTSEVVEVAEEDEAVSNCGGIFTATVDETDLAATDAVGSN